jgi:hypothetical protein
MKYETTLFPDHLAEEGHSDDHAKFMSGSSGVYQLVEFLPWALIAGEVHLFYDFVIFQLNNG